MKIKETKKDFNTVEYFRKIKEQIAKEFEGKTFEQKKEIIEKMKRDDSKQNPSKKQKQMIEKS